MGFCSGFSRILLITFNFVFWLSGAAILGVGVWILVDPSLQDYLDVVKDATSDEEFLKTAAYILIGFGSFVFLVGFCGCCGAIRSSKCLLGFYILFLILVFGGELAAGIYVVIYRGEVEDKFDSGVAESVNKRYNQLASSWDKVQLEFKCCGGMGPEDYKNSTYAQKEGREWALPESCCDRKDGEVVNKDKCMKAEGDYRTKGCKKSLLDWVNDHSIIIIGIGFGIAALEIIGLVCAICFWRNMNHQEKYSG